MKNKHAERDRGLCKQTFEVLCTLFRLGLKFKCPLEKVILMKVENDLVKDITQEVYRRKR